MSAIETAVVLCGGRGTRLGTLGQTLPKSLIDVMGKPILWYILRRLVTFGVKRIILPLGYRGEMIRAFVETAFAGSDIEFIAVDTGEKTEIAARIGMIRPHIRDRAFLLLNGDAVFDFDFLPIAAQAMETDLMATLLSVDVISNFGMLISRGGKLEGFRRDVWVRDIVVDELSGLAPGMGTIYSGMAILHEACLDLIDLKTATNFETELYPKLIDMGQAQTLRIKGYWHTMDTAKDVEEANADFEGQRRAGEMSQLLAKLQ